MLLIDPGRKINLIIPNFAIRILQNLPRRGRPRKSRRDFRALALRNSKEFLRISHGQSFRLTGVEVSQKFTCIFLCKPFRREVCSNAIFGIIITIYSAAVFLYSMANAQDKNTQKDTATTEIRSSARYVPSRKINASPGEIGITAIESDYNYEVKAGRKVPLKFSLGSQYIGIINTTEVILPSKLTGLNTGIETTLPFFKFNDSYLRIRINPGFYNDNWNISTSSFRIPLHSFIIYKPEDKWVFIAGIAVYPDFENNLRPILGFIYRPNDKLTYNIVPKNPNINYRLNERTDLFTEAGLSVQEFEVNKGDLKNIILEYTETRLAAGVRYKFNKLIQSAFAFGKVFNRSLKYQDNSGKAVIKDAVYTEFKMEITI